MTREQRIEQLKVANRTRLAIAELRRLVRAGELTADHVVAGDVPAHLQAAAGAIHVDSLIHETPRFGAGRLRTIERRTGVTTRRVRELTPRRRDDLVAAIRDLTPSTRKAA